MRFLYYYIKYKIISWFIKKDKSLVPTGSYCYKITSIDYSKPAINTKVCPYYKVVTVNKETGENTNACLFIGYYGDDMCFDDQVKLCGVNDDYYDELKESIGV